MQHLSARRRTSTGAGRVRRTACLVASFLLVSIGLVGFAGSATAEGNNGTVKIDGWTLDHGTGNGAPNRNEPHVGCSFDVEWYNYDADVTSTITFEMWAPTKDVGLSGDTPTQVQLDGDDASGANAAGLDATQPYTLRFDGPSKTKHMYHLKVTVETPLTNGQSDKKSKVFWVEGCGPIDLIPTVDMEDACGTANDSGPTYVTENDFWTAAPGQGNTIVFTAKDGFYWLPGDHVGDDGTTYTVGYAPNTDVACPEEDQPIPTTPSVQMHDECGTENDTGPTYNASSAYWTAAPGQGNTIVFTAKDGYYFPAGPNVGGEGSTYTVSYTANTDAACPSVIPINPSVQMVDVCGTANDQGPLFVADNQYWTAALGEGNTVVFSAKGDWFFADSPKVSNQGTTWTEPYAPNTNVACPENPPQPPGEPVHEDLPGCDLSDLDAAWGAGVASRDGVRDYVWDGDSWELEDESLINWGAYSFTPYDDAQFVTAGCQPPQPPDSSRSDSGEREGCRLNGVMSWTDTWTTTYAWDLEARDWVGTETGPVREKSFTEYTDKQFLRLCTDVLGEQEEDDEGNQPEVEVKGEQGVVPNAVDAGLETLPSALAGSDHNPLWLLPVGGGLVLMGAAGWRRRETVTR